MGYCFLEVQFLKWQEVESFKAFHPFHGNLATPEVKIIKIQKGKIVVFHGTADTVVPFSEFVLLAVELEKQE